MKNRKTVIKVLPVDGHPVVLEGVRSCLGRCGRFSVVGTAFNTDDAITKANRLSPDVVLMDMSTAGLSGIEATRRLRSSCPGAKVVMFVEREEKQTVEQMVQAGARGCIRKTVSTDELAVALERVHNGETFFSPDVARMFFDDYVMRGGKPRESAAPTISERERQVLNLVVEGAANKVIADSLKISIRTVEKHRQRIMKKFNLHKATDLVRFAITRGLVNVGI
jgi:two-component system, NarL family, nitrate/nitrite response regulator NarL